MEPNERGSVPEIMQPFIDRAVQLADLFDRVREIVRTLPAAEQLVFDALLDEGAITNQETLAAYMVPPVEAIAVFYNLFERRLAFYRELLDRIEKVPS